MEWPRDLNPRKFDFSNTATDIEIELDAADFKVINYAPILFFIPNSVGVYSGFE